MTIGIIQVIILFSFVVLAYVFSIFLRWDSFLGLAGAENLEATYHVLWTMKVMMDTPVSSHWLLPSVTLHPSPGNDYVWGATVPTAGGSYIYTSFPPLGFLIPLIALTLVGASVNLFSLAIFNSLVGLVAAIGFGGLCTAVAMYVDRTQIDKINSSDGAISSSILFLASTIMYLLLRESLHSHGVVYWHQSLSQVVFIFASWLAFRQFTCDSRPWERWGLVALCATFPLLEWTGYVFNFGLFLAFVLRNGMRLEKGIGRYAGASWSAVRALTSGWPIAIAITTLLVGLVTLLHLIAVLGVHDSLAELVRRAGARSGISSNPIKIAGLLIKIPVRYCMSVAALAPLGLMAGFAAWRRGLLKPTSPLFQVLAITIFPLLENALLLQHANEFSFDRLKIAVPLGVALFAFIGSLTPRNRAPAVSLAVILVLATNVAGFLKQQDSFSAWPSINAANHALAARLRAQPEAQCALYGADISVRGYLNLLFMRDVYEIQDARSLSRKAEEQPSCGFVLLRSRFIWQDQLAIESIEIYSRNASLINVLTPAKAEVTQRLR